MANDALLELREKFWRSWYEQMKAADPHHFEEYEEIREDGFSLYPPYTFEQFCKSSMARFAWEALRVDIWAAEAPRDGGEG